MKGDQSAFVRDKIGLRNLEISHVQLFANDVFFRARAPHSTFLEYR